MAVPVVFCPHLPAGHCGQQAGAGTVLLQLARVPGRSRNGMTDLFILNLAAADLLASCAACLSRPPSTRWTTGSSGPWFVRLCTCSSTSPCTPAASPWRLSPVDRCAGLGGSGPVWRRGRREWGTKKGGGGRKEQLSGPTYTQSQGTCRAYLGVILPSPHLHWANPENIMFQVSAQGLALSPCSESVK